MKYTITATGILTAETPVSVSPPDHIDKKARLAKLAREIVYQHNVPVETPIIPASTFRGSLRHAVTGYAFEELNAIAGEKIFKVADYIWTAQGGVTQKKEKGTETYVEVEEPARIRVENPIMSLWGNFTHKMASRIEMRAARAIDLEDSIIHVAPQVRTDPMERNYDLQDTFDVLDLEAFNIELESRRKMVKALNEVERLEKILARFKDGKIDMDAKRVKETKRVNETKDRIAKLNAEAEEAADKAGGTVNLQQRTGKQEAIAQGADLSHGWVLKDVTIGEAAAFILALRVWISNGSRVGAMKRNGFGQLKGFYDLTVKPMSGVDRLRAPTKAGRISFDYESGLSVDSDNAVISEVLLATDALISGGIKDWQLKAS